MPDIIVGYSGIHNFTASTGLYKSVRFATNIEAQGYADPGTSKPAHAGNVALAAHQLLI